MNFRFCRYAIYSLLLFIYSASAFSLTIHQFSEICRSEQGKCSDNLVINAYVGGALDLLATLHEETEYLETLYCKEPAALFDVPTIIRYMEQRALRSDQRNAMFLFIGFFEKRGGCNQ